MFNRVSFKKLIFVIIYVFVMLFLPFFYGSSVFAENTSDINLDLWKWEENCDDQGNALSLSLTEYSADDKDSCENIVIPNVCDIFLESSDGDKYKSLKTVFISKSFMNELAKKVSKYNGTLKVSHNYGGTVTAFDKDWTDCFNFENNNIREIDLSHFDTEDIENMSNMFANCKNLEMLNVSDFNTINVTSMCGMFSGCENLEEIDLSSFDTENVVDMHKMFFDCKKLKQLDLFNFDTGSVGDVYGMFSGCENLEGVNLSSFNTENVINMREMFFGCKKLKQLDLSNFDTQNVKNVSKMFKNTDLQILDLSSFSFSDETDTEEMFDEVSLTNNLVVLSNELSFDVLTELTKNRNAMNLKFIFGENEYFVFDSVVFCPSDLGVTKKRNESLDDYLDRILEKKFDITKERIKKENEYPDGTIINSQPKENYSMTEEKLNGEYIFTVKLPLVERTDFEWPEVVEDLKYDGQSKELFNSGFISEKLKDDGVKLEYAWAKNIEEITEDEWSDQIPTATDIGTYKICVRINGGEKYQNVYYVDDDGNDYLKVKIYERELQEGEDYEFAKTSSNLEYDGKEKKLLSGGFVRQEKKK